MSFFINIEELRERAAKRVATMATLANRLPDEPVEPPETGSRVAEVAGHVDDSAQALHDDLMAAIDGATRERGDPAWNVLALHAECQHLSDREKRDLIEHFAEVEEIWRRANAGLPLDGTS
jgi:hypothetical protein